MCGGTVREPVFYTAGSRFQGWSWIPHGGLHSIIRSLDPTIPRRSSNLETAFPIDRVVLFFALARFAGESSASPAGRPVHVGPGDERAVSFRPCRWSRCAAGLGDELQRGAQRLAGRASGL